MLELKLDTNTAFEWHTYSQDSEDATHYSKLLEFYDLRAKASEAPVVENKRNTRNHVHSSKKPNNQGSGGQKSPLSSGVSDHTCVVCKEKHPLYVCMYVCMYICGQFKSFNRDRRLSIWKSNNLCLNCLEFGHFAKSYQLMNCCQKCQKLHHTLLHHLQETTSSPVSSNSSIQRAASKF